MASKDIAYYNARLAEELAAAEAAACPEASEAHRDLARRYSEMLERERLIVLTTALDARTLQS